MLKLRILPFLNNNSFLSIYSIVRRKRGASKKGGFKKEPWVPFTMGSF